MIKRTFYYLISLFLFSCTSCIKITANEYVNSEGVFQLFMFSGIQNIYFNEINSSSSYYMYMDEDFACTRDKAVTPLHCNYSGSDKNSKIISNKYGIEIAKGKPNSFYAINFGAALRYFFKDNVFVSFGTKYYSKGLNDIQNTDFVFDVYGSNIDLELMFGYLKHVYSIGNGNLFLGIQFGPTYSLKQNNIQINLRKIFDLVIQDKNNKENNQKSDQKIFLYNSNSSLQDGELGYRCTDEHVCQKSVFTKLPKCKLEDDVYILNKDNTDIFHQNTNRINNNYNLGISGGLIIQYQISKFITGTFLNFQYQMENSMRFLNDKITISDKPLKNSWEKLTEFQLDTDNDSTIKNYFPKFSVINLDTTELIYEGRLTFNCGLFVGVKF